MRCRGTVRAALCRHINLGHVVAVLGREDTALNLELLQSVERWQEQIRVEAWIRVFDSVESVVVEEDSLTGDADCGLRPGATLPGGADCGRRAVRCNAGRETSQ